MQPDRPRIYPLGQYVREEAAREGVLAYQVMDRCRSPAVVRARWRVMKRLRDDGASLKKIGTLLGGFDHTTVIYALRRVS